MSITNESPNNKPNRRSIHPVNAALAAVGLIGIGVMIGGLSGTNASTANASAVTGLAVDPNGNFLYRTFENGRVERLVLGRGVTKSGTTADWELFRAN